MNVIQARHHKQTQSDVKSHFSAAVQRDLRQTCRSLGRLHVKNEKVGCVACTRHACFVIRQGARNFPRETDLK